MKMFWLALGLAWLLCAGLAQAAINLDGATDTPFELLETKPFQALQGFVRDGEGNPLACVRLEVFALAALKDSVEKPDRKDAASLAVWQTGADGAFSFNDLPAGAYEVRASVAGGAWNTTRLYIKIRPNDNHAKKRPIELPMTLKE